ncbi:hypothetical protein QCA50_007522 [Cerrena zonata]|uniref:Uncharacterized protein n=1 Tax=Cerrena zonata TaxID=2478898 RepID=A0AAW0GFE6_9APHY
MCRGDMESNLLGPLSNIIFAIHIFCSVVAQWGILSIKSVNLFDSFPTKVITSYERDARPITIAVVFVSLSLQGYQAHEYFKSVPMGIAAHLVDCLQYLRLNL